VSCTSSSSQLGGRFTFQTLITLAIFQNPETAMTQLFRGARPKLDSSNATCFTLGSFATKPAHDIDMQMQCSMRRLLGHHAKEAEPEKVHHVPIFDSKKVEKSLWPKSFISHHFGFWKVFSKRPGSLWSQR